MIYTPQSIASDGIIPSIAKAGGKGSGLYWLHAQGFPAPPTWVLDTALFDSVVERIGMAATVCEIERATASSLDWSSTQLTLNRLEPQRWAIVKALRASAIPAELHEALLRLPKHSQWAVRSSATVEDSESYSYAGQFASILAVSPAVDKLEQAIREVWASTFKREVLAYRAQSGSPMPHMAVILQPMYPITARDRSGVALSQSPIPTMPGVMIQAAFGAGRTVVEGRGGDIYMVQDQVVKARPMPPPSIMITDTAEGEIAAPTPPGFSLTNNEAQQLANYVLAMSMRWGRPINIEFVWYAREQEPLFVQIRSISDKG
jgi:phosphoenolpyruvate synthase/pyruvate phosphate dikinase